MCVFLFEELSPLMSRVAPGGSRWQNLLPLVVFAGWWSGYFGFLDAKQARPDDTNWTGAEIKSCCRLASLLDVPLVQAAQNVVPGEHTAASRRHVSHPPYH